MEYLKTAEDIFKEIESLFPNLKMIFEYNHPYMDLSVNIPAQSGLDFSLNMSLQNEDELHITSDFIWCEYFPIADCKEEFITNVKEILNGNYRVKQFIKNDIVYKSFLQKPNNNNNKWETIYKHYHKFGFPWTKYKENIIQNGKDSILIKMY